MSRNYTHKNFSTHNENKNSFTTENNKNKLIHYLDSKSDIIGNIHYDVNIPPPVSDFRLLHYPLAAEVYCSYRPTLLEFQSLFHLASVSDVGPPVDLIDPTSSYPPGSPDQLHPDDASLLVGVNTPWGSNIQTLHNQQQDVNESSNHRDDSCITPDEVFANPVDAILKQFENVNNPKQLSDKTPRHPKRPELKPVRTFPVLPHPKLWTNNYIQASLQRVDPSTFKDSTLLLEDVGSISQRLRTFALYETSQEQDFDNNDSTIKDESSTSLTAPVYNFVRDFVAKFPESDQRTNTGSLVFDFPRSVNLRELPSTLSTSQKEEGSNPVYFFNLCGTRILFNKSTTYDGKRYRPPIRITKKSLTTEETIAEAKQWKCLQDTSSCINEQQQTLSSSSKT